MSSNLSESKYKAPALEKGLQILEMLAATSEPIGLTEIANRTNRSKNEIVRLVYVLEEMGFIERDPAQGGYTITNRIFNIASARPATRSIIEVALPEMRRLAADIRQSCHLVVRSGPQIVVVGRIEAPNEMSLAVRVGHHRPLTDSASGAVLYSFQPDDEKLAVKRLLQKTESKASLARFIKRAEEAKERGYERRPNNLLHDVIDLSVPILRAESAVAAVTIPFVRMEGHKLDEEGTTSRLMLCSSTISQALSPHENY